MDANVIVGVISLFVSIIVFVSTVIIDRKERSDSLNREQVLLFTQKMDSFLKIVDSQSLLDNQEMIYSNTYANRAEISKQYANVQRLLAEMRYCYQMVLLYIPKITPVIKTIVEQLDCIEDRFVRILNQFGNDLLEFSREAKRGNPSGGLINEKFKKQGEIAYQESVSYNFYYTAIVSLLLEGLSLAQRQSTKLCSPNEIDAYLVKYQEYTIMTAEKIVKNSLLKNEACMSSIAESKPFVINEK